jgi:hypothetical protein
MRRFVELLTVLVMVVTLTACQEIVVAPRNPVPVAVRKPGPPPHAPAHGYRRKHERGADLRFDAKLGVYVVEGQADIYFYDGWFIRIRNGVWEVSARIGGDWQIRSARWVPSGLRAKYHDRGWDDEGRGAAKAKY